MVLDMPAAPVPRVFLGTFGYSDSEIEKEAGIETEIEEEKEKKIEEEDRTKL